MLRNLMMAGVMVCVAVANVQADDPTHDGTVVSITRTELVMIDRADTKHTHSYASDTRFTLDGKDCTATALKSGMKIRVTTKTGEAKVATHVEALDKNKLFANTHDGQLVSITNKKLVMTGKDGKEHAHAIAEGSKLTLDGKACKAADLKAGMKIRVTTKKADTGTAVGIEAIDKDAEFARTQ